MIDEERVREMTKLAAYEVHDGKKYHQITRFFRGDFVGRHLLKGFFCATAAYGLLLAVWGVYHMDELLENLDTMDLVQFGISVLVKYLIFLIVYLIAVDIYANMFYAAGRRSLRRHQRRLKYLTRLYEEQEERKVPNRFDPEEEDEA